MEDSSFETLRAEFGIRPHELENDNPATALEKHCEALEATVQSLTARVEALESAEVQRQERIAELQELQQRRVEEFFATLDTVAPSSLWPFRSCRSPPTVDPRSWRKTDGCSG